MAEGYLKAGKYASGLMICLRMGGGVKLAGVWRPENLAYLASYLLGNLTLPSFRQTRNTLQYIYDLKSIRFLGRGVLVQSWHAKSST